MKANLQRLSAMISKAHKASIFERATLAMNAVDTAAALLWEMAQEIDSLKARLAAQEAKGGES